jgi:hypothetical protein
MDGCILYVTWSGPTIVLNWREAAKEDGAPLRINSWRRNLPFPSCARRARFLSPVTLFLCSCLRGAHSQVNKSVGGLETRHEENGLGTGMKSGCDKYDMMVMDKRLADSSREATKRFTKGRDE